QARALPREAAERRPRLVDGRNELPRVEHGQRTVNDEQRLEEPSEAAPEMGYDAAPARAHAGRRPGDRPLDRPVDPGEQHEDREHEHARPRGGTEEVTPQRNEPERLG